MLAGVGYLLLRDEGDDPGDIATASTSTSAATSAPAASAGPAPTASSGAATFGELEVAVGAPKSDGSSLVVPVHLHNRLTASSVHIGELRYTLGLDNGDIVAGAERLNTQSVEPGTTGEVEIVFPEAGDSPLDSASLTIDAPGKVPLELALADGSAITAAPSTVTAAGTATFIGPVATFTYVVDDAVLSFDRGIEEGPVGLSAADRRADVGTSYLALTVSLTANACECPGGVNWVSTDLRLVVDGVSVTPWTSSSGIVEAGATVTLEVGFVVPDGAEQIVFDVGSTAGDPAGQIVISQP